VFEKAVEEAYFALHKVLLSDRGQEMQFRHRRIISAAIYVLKLFR